MPKYELILVYPGIGHKKPFGLKSIISELSGRIKEFEELIIGIKNIQMKIIKKINIIINFLKK